MTKARPACNPNGAQNPLLPNTCVILKDNRRSRMLWKTCLVAVLITFLLFLLAFLVIFVGFPLYFKNSVDFERSFIFLTDEEYRTEENDFLNPEGYGLLGTRNLYAMLSINSTAHDGTENVTLGVWHLLPEALLTLYNLTDAEDRDANFTELLLYSDYPVIVHFHGNGGSRIDNTGTYRVLRQFFHVIAFDYRGYADSTDYVPEEEAIVRDCVELYKWVRERTNADIYFWGHSLGTALSTETAARLREEEDVVPTGIFLEAPFTSLREAVLEIKLSKVFTWLPWYEETFLDPLEEHGFRFETNRHIFEVDCPIMIVHAKDDVVIPYYLGERLYNLAHDRRNHDQGNVTFHLIPANLRCNHWQIYKAPNLPNFIRDHIALCQNFKLGRG